MGTLIKYQIIRLLREKEMLIWSLAFPIVLTLLFMGMFANMGDAFKLNALPMGVVKDAAFKAAPGLPEMIDDISTEFDGSSDAGKTKSVQLIDAVDYEDAASADEAAREGDVDGYIQVVDGTPVLHVMPRANSSASSLVLRSALDVYTQRSDQFRRVLPVVEEGLGQEAPGAPGSEALAEAGKGAPAGAGMTGAEGAVAPPGAGTGVDGAAFKSAAGASGMDAVPPAIAQAVSTLSTPHASTREVSLTAHDPDPVVRYYFALLAFACGMGMPPAIAAAKEARANSSIRGVRQELAAIARWKVAASCLAGSWVCIFACMTLAFLFMWGVAGVDFGANAGWCFVAIASSSLMSCSCGLLLGTFARMTPALASGLLCFLSLFTGLYGPVAQNIADLVAYHAPLLSAANPLWQSAQCFYALLYYDDLAPFAANCAVLAAMAAVAAVLAFARMRRMSHEHL